MQQELLFYDDRILVASTGDQVMMSWELPLMRRMAEIVSQKRGDILEIGFGMGLSANAVHALKPRSHTIVEAHPQILARARRWATGKPTVTVIAGRWQEVWAELATFDGILFDVFGGEAQRDEFFSGLGDLLRPGGVATLWLGDERQLPKKLGTILSVAGFRHRLVRVRAIPDRRCTYSRSNEFWLPIIRHARGPA